MHTIEYLQSLLPEPSEKVKNLESYAKEHNVPIMEPLGIDFLMQLIRIHQPKRILEIGTAIGYSALRMLEASPKSQIITMERDEQRITEARKNIRAFNAEDRVIILSGDALNLKEEAARFTPYDLLFIDAAKGKYEEFFNLYAPLIADKGIIVSDNVLFKGYVADPSQTNSRLSQMAKKIRNFNETLNSRNDYHTTIVPIGDGVAITVKNH
ncbi:O-methyltransferase [Halobacillus sp. Marseille-Q1614]|uniref:O-methyltransferase n=1 Tax=Halobacillus sp. Marseille-Q1614 TaxID=2709134 RepID=UPI001570FA5C|nr:O-methyltransferase [Halobacillus sp. Marseille-Q1614]